jgi:hypothetical protein
VGRKERKPDSAADKSTFQDEETVSGTVALSIGMGDT